MPAKTNESATAGPAFVPGRLAGQHEDAGADDHADAEDGQLDGAELLAELVLGLLGVGDRLLDGLRAREVHWRSILAVQGSLESNPEAQSVTELPANRADKRGRQGRLMQLGPLGARDRALWSGRVAVSPRGASPIWSADR